MKDRIFSRRRFLAGTGLAGAAGGALLLAGRSAQAFRIQKMDAETHAIYLNACGSVEARAYHRKLLEEATARLQGTMSAEQVTTALARLTCPVCGCPLES